MTKSPSSAKMLDTSALTSTTVEPTTLAHQPVPAALVISLGAANTRLVSVVHISSDVAKNAATEAATNNQGVHNNPDTVIASVVEDIQVEEGNKSTDPQAIGNVVKPEHEDVPMQAMEDINEGPLEVEGIVDVPKENVILEQVTSTKTHDCNSL